MNHLAIVLVSMVAGGIVFWKQFIRLQDLHGEDEIIRMRAANMRKEIDETAGQMAYASNLIQQATLRLKEAGTSVLIPEQAPQHEPLFVGHQPWSATKDYFSIHKQFLRDFSANDFTEDYRIPDRLAQLLGLRQSERLKLQDVVDDAAWQMKQKELESLRKGIAHPKDLAETKGAVISYSCEVPPDELERLRGEFLADLRENLGPQRTELFLSNFPKAYGDFDLFKTGKTFTFVEGPNFEGKLERKVVITGKDGASHFPLGQEGEVVPDIPRRYQHLFPDLEKIFSSNKQ